MGSRFSYLVVHAAAVVSIAVFSCPALVAQNASLPDAPAPTAVVMADNKPPAPLDFSSSVQQTKLPKPGDQNQAPSLGDLGLSPEQTRPDLDAQHRLDRRTHDLKVHQELGIVTLAPLAAACITSALAPPDPRNGSGGNTTGRDVHVALGSLSVAMYGATAYYAIKAPRIFGQAPTEGGIKLHKYLIYIHAPGILLTPILGAMAFNQAADGEKVHGIASAHAAVAWTTVAAYTASIIAVSWPIHIPFTGKK